METVVIEASAKSEVCAVRSFPKQFFLNLSKRIGAIVRYIRNPDAHFVSMMDERLKEPGFVSREEIMEALKR